MNDKIQKILWRIAGVEINILEKCRTDYVKYSAIGATILMTAFIAFIAGTSAAWFFTKNENEPSGCIGWSMLFGVVWATLIFCIDRSLVITLKKDPSLKKQKFWVPLFSRSILAIIVAFMVSIPLELVIFEDFIAEQKFFFDELLANDLSNKTLAHNEEVSVSKNIEFSAQSINRLDELANSLSEEILVLTQKRDKLVAKINHPETGTFNKARNKVNELSTSIKDVQTHYNNSTNQSDKDRYSELARLYQNEIKKQNQIIQNELSSWNIPIKKEINRLEKIVSQKEVESMDNKEKYKKESERLINNRNIQDSLSAEKGKIVSRFKTKSRQGNHFIQNFRILEYAVWKRDAKGNLPTEWYFLWMVRLLFFIIEILPTVVKMATPIGSYDRMVYAEEQNLLSYLNSSSYVDGIRNMHQLELQIYEEQLKLRQETELELKKRILKKMEKAQMAVADAAIVKWKEDEMKKLCMSEEQTDVLRCS